MLALSKYHFAFPSIKCLLQKAKKKSPLQRIEVFTTECITTREYQSIFICRIEKWKQNKLLIIRADVLVQMQHCVRERQREREREEKIHNGIYVCIYWERKKERNTHTRTHTHTHTHTYIYIDREKEKVKKRERETRFIQNPSCHPEYL